MSVAPQQPDSVDVSIEWMRKHFDSEAAQGFPDVVFEVELLGEGGGPLQLRVAGGRAEIERGSLVDPDVRFRLQAADWLGVLAGRENADLLYMAGRLAVEGELSLAIKLRSLFRAG